MAAGGAFGGGDVEGGRVEGDTKGKGACDGEERCAPSGYFGSGERWFRCRCVQAWCVS